MRGSKQILILAIVVLITGTSIASACTIHSEPIGKTVNPGIVFVEFDQIRYCLVTPVKITLTFEKVDATHHKIRIIPLDYRLLDFDCILIQWEYFAPAVIQLESGGGNDWLIGTETGYAEK